MVKRMAAAATGIGGGDRAGHPAADVPGDHESRGDVSMLLTLCMFLGGVLLGIETFGREFHQQTSTLWLALPMSRAGLWRAKLKMAGLAVAGVVLLNWMLLLASAPLRGFLPNLERGHPTGGCHVRRRGLGPLLVGAPASDLGGALDVADHAGSADDVDPVAGGAASGPRRKATRSRTQPDFGGMFAFGFCRQLVSIAFFLARQRFDQLEDLGPLGEDVQLKVPRFLANLLRVGAPSERRTRRANRSLWWKEIRLQQVNLALAAGFALVLLVTAPPAICGAVDVRAVQSPAISSRGYSLGFVESCCP